MRLIHDDVGLSVQLEWSWVRNVACRRNVGYIGIPVAEGDSCLLARAYRINFYTYRTRVLRQRSYSKVPERDSR